MRFKATTINDKVIIVDADKIYGYIRESFSEEGKTQPKPIGIGLERPQITYDEILLLNRWHPVESNSAKELWEYYNEGL